MRTWRKKIHEDQEAARMKDQISISNATIDRLPLYFRTLRLAQDEGIDIISSEELGRRLG
ncbi:MAG: hypothetical protein II042_05035, partial [Erysipelotrichaceae bacterium]|nr:hypothetical protein [Erysipelotrichaceae bacterium]